MFHPASATTILPSHCWFGAQLGARSERYRGMLSSCRWVSEKYPCEKFVGRWRKDGKTRRPLERRILNPRVQPHQPCEIWCWFTCREVVYAAIKLPFTRWHWQNLPVQSRSALRGFRFRSSPTTRYSAFLFECNKMHHQIVHIGLLKRSLHIQSRLYCITEMLPKHLDSMLKESLSILICTDCMMLLVAFKRKCGIVITDC